MCLIILNFVQNLKYGVIQTEKKTSNCKNCENITLFKNEFCSVKCAAIFTSISRRKVERPNKGELVSKLKEGKFVSVGKLYKVTDNTIRKWCRYYDIPDKAKDYK